MLINCNSTTQFLQCYKRKSDLEHGDLPYTNWNL